MALVRRFRLLWLRLVAVCWPPLPLPGPLACCRHCCRWALVCWRRLGRRVWCHASVIVCWWLSAGRPSPPAVVGCGCAWWDWVAVCGVVLVVCCLFLASAVAGCWCVGWGWVLPHVLPHCCLLQLVGLLVWLLARCVGGLYRNGCGSSCCPPRAVVVLVVAWCWPWSAAAAGVASMVGRTLAEGRTCPGLVAVAGREALPGWLCVLSWLWLPGCRAAGGI